MSADSEVLSMLENHRGNVSIFTDCLTSWREFLALPFFPAPIKGAEAEIASLVARWRTD